MVVLNILNTYAQRATDEHPYGLTDVLRMQIQVGEVLSAPDLSLVVKEDSINDQIPGPVRFAFPVRVNYNTENSGMWQHLEDGSKIWRLKVKIQGALSTHTYYDRFWLPEGTKFWVYSEDTRQYIGAIISDFIGGSREKPVELFTVNLLYTNTINLLL